jgi:hypothetical protein
MGKWFGHLFLKHHGGRRAMSPDSGTRRLIGHRFCHHSRAREALVFIQVGRLGRIDMPRASRRGYLRLSLVSCPIYLSPATARTKPIRLHQVWRGPPDEGGGELGNQVGGEDVSGPPASRLIPDHVEEQAERIHPATSFGLTNPAPAKRSRKKRSSKVTNTNAANTSPSHRTS